MGWSVVDRQQHRQRLPIVGSPGRVGGALLLDSKAELIEDHAHHREIRCPRAE
jgi:hypothetical protein